jgi:hypothetical protein
MATSGNPLFGRRVRLTIAVPVSTPNDFTHTTTDVIEINGGQTDDPNQPGLRIVFKVKRKLEKEPNTSEISVYNLSSNRRAQLQQKGLKVLLEAGYKSTGLSRYFSGDVRSVDHVRKGPDWETVIKLGDGERAWRFARVNESFAVGSRAADVLMRIAQKTGLGMGNVDKQAASIDKLFDQGYVAAGNAMAALTKLVESIGKRVSVQDGHIQILGTEETLDLPVPVVSPDTGLIGSPEMGSPPTKGKPQLLKFKSLLIPVKPGSKVNLRSERYPNAFVRVHNVTFDGDSHGKQWFSEMEATILKNAPAVDVVSSA